MQNLDFFKAAMAAKIAALKAANNPVNRQFREGTPARLHLGKHREEGNGGAAFVTLHMAMRSANKGFVPLWYGL